MIRHIKHLIGGLIIFFLILTLIRGFPGRKLRRIIHKFVFKNPWETSRFDKTKEEERAHV